MRCFYCDEPATQKVMRGIGKCDAHKDKELTPVIIVTEGSDIPEVVLRLDPPRAMTIEELKTYVRERMTA